MTDAKDYRSTVFLPRTSFPMKAGLASQEPKWLERWKRLDLYGRLRRERAGRERFLLHDGPPYANGDIHIGHALNKILKDVIVRSQTLLGKDAPYVPGWDCHGLPIEWKIEEQYRKRGKNKDEVPPREFREECRAFAAHWVDVQRAEFERLGVMGDWDDPYLTMTFDAEATIVAELLKFAETGQLYRGSKPVMWSPVEKTALAEAEVEYEEITSTQVDVAFEITHAPNAPELVGAHAVIWTTTPWTIPVNQAIAYGPEVDYVLVEAAERRLMLAEPLVDSVLARISRTLSLEGEGRVRVSDAGDQDSPVGSPLTPALSPQGRGVLWRGKGAQLAGAVARHPMHHLGGFFARPRPFLAGDFVTTDTGTGLVHMAPDHGEDDFALCKAHGIQPVFAVEPDGRYRADWPGLGGQGPVINNKFNAPDGPICSDLREAGALLAASADFRHSYPHSWRSKAKVIYRCTPQWFIAMDRPIPDGSSIPLCAEEERIRRAQQRTLRQTALAAIDVTRWVPERSRNRIRAMVEGRPDWVISRQRAWGVPITLFVNRKTGEYLRDAAVNARIIAAVREGGADAWLEADRQALLGNEYSADDFEAVTDILDVWFDSGSTHAFVVEGRYGEGTRASLYVEGSDQHRGWFQSSLLESCGTRGRAPYEAVLTHGFTLDAQGRKMSKSLGNTVDPLEVVKTSGADILRLWVCSTDYFEDVRIGKEILAGTTDAYRKLRNTFRYLLGALDGFDEAERVDSAEMPELERWVLHRLAELDRELKEAVEAFEFNRYVTALSTFANNDLSAFYFDIRKDSLYCDSASAPKRRACRTVLDILFHALTRWLAPILPFTTEEAWQSRFPSEDGSVHLLEWPEVEGEWLDEGLSEKWKRIWRVRQEVTASLEKLRRDKRIGSSLEAALVVRCFDPADLVAISSVDMAEICIVSEFSALRFPAGDYDAPAAAVMAVDPRRTEQPKCVRCWRHLPDVGERSPELCNRCAEVVSELHEHGSV